MNKTLFNAMLGIAVLIFIGAWFYSGTIKPDYATEAEAQPDAILDRIRPVSETVRTGSMPSQDPGVAAASPGPAAVAATVTAMVDKVSETPVVVTDTIEKPAGDAAKKLGEETYASACFACHTTGIAGSPKLGDTEAWAPRIAQGIATLNEHAIKGFQGSTGMMPPKGGRVDLSDEAIIAAVAYMVAESGGT